jgi:multiple sugar transport system ATP-binding protein
VAYRAAVARVRLDNVTKRFGSGDDEVVAVDRVSLDVEDRDFMILLGPSGCGKSTLLRTISGLEDPDEGLVWIGDRMVNHIEPKDRDVAMVFQSYALYPHKTVQANIEFPLKARRVGKEERAAAAREAAAVLGLTDYLARKPGQLSGGQRQRVALARAIVRHPAVFCMDEPLSNLDAKLRAETRAELVALHQRLATTFIYVTHDQVEAMTMGTRVAVMSAGVLQQVGTPQEVYDRPETVFVAQFIGTPPMNILPAGSLEPSDLLVGVRPEFLRFTPDGPVEATVTLVEHLGHEVLVACRLAGGERVTVRLPAESDPPAAGCQVRLDAELRHRHRFDPVTKRRVER